MTTASGATHELLADATRLVTTTQLGSPSMLQRKLRVGFGLAVRLLNDLEELGIVAPAVTASATRDVLMDHPAAMALLARRALR